MSEANAVNLTRAELAQLEHEISIELSHLEPAPTLESLKQQGYTENSTLNGAIDFIAGLGRIATLLIAELIQSGAALIIGVVFAILEYQRVFHGAAALGQDAGNASLIAVAVVAANIVHPIYSLRGMRGQKTFTVTNTTLRGHASNMARWIFSKPSEQTVDRYHNPTLHRAANVITWSTVILAIYDLLSPLMTQLLTGAYTKPIPIMVVELVMGLGLSIAGMFFLQSAAHEIGVRIITDQPKRLADVLQAKQSERAEREQLIREAVRARFEAGKLAERERKAAQRIEPTNTNIVPVAESEPSFLSQQLPARIASNGSGNGYHTNGA